MSSEFRYVIWERCIEGSANIDEFGGAFTDLVQAWDEAEYLWNHLTDREKKNWIISVMLVKADDLDDSDDWGSWTNADPVKTFSLEQE